jgi:DNA polymerase III delta prime subunit
MSSECIVTEYTEDSREKHLRDSLDDNESNFKINNSETFSNKTDKNEMTNKTELEKLIYILEKGIKNKEPGIKYIKYPELLVIALKELNELVGLDRVKESVAIQTVRLIEILKTGDKSPKMLNTILYGPPGVGKTTAGIKLAKIWFALGFLNPSGSTKTKKTIFEIPKGGDMTTFALLLIAWLGTYAIQFLSYAYDKIGLFWLAFIIGFFLFIIILVYYSDKEGTWITKYTTTEEVNDEKIIKTFNDRDIISVVSRNEFVGEYLGHTAGKTKKLLEANIGKVLFIDEAYSLLNDARDAYGFESLNALNLFLSENPDKIVVIFAGYKEQMKNSIFQAQPGLERRCMWTFECDPYNGQELSEIFFLQAKEENWSISKNDRIKIKRLIAANENAFKALGGDTSRLLYLASLEASRNNFATMTETFLSTENDSKTPKEKVLKFRDVEKGLILLKENRF